MSATQGYLLDTNIVLHATRHPRCNSCLSFQSLIRMQTSKIDINKAASKRVIPTRISGWFSPAK